jgi:SH3 domain-containing YSC84-like protein 1
MKMIYMLPLISTLSYSPSALATVRTSDIQHRVDEAVTSFQDLMSVPERGIPRQLMQAATCVATINLYKAGFGLGAEGGLGLASCRNEDGIWSPPFFVNMAGTSFGFQIGVEKVDLTLVFTNRNARANLTSTNFKLGGDVGLTAGPVGRDLSAGTNYNLEDAIYSYSSSKGLFGGLTLEGSLLYQDRDYDTFVYGNVRPKAITELPPSQTPASVEAYVNVLTYFSN